jgi:hypothetical protein
MPKGTYFTYPIDEPVKVRDGVMYREADYHGSAHHIALAPEHPEREAKGDLGEVHMKDFEPRASFESPGAPWKNLRKGK